MTFWLHMFQNTTLRFVDPGEFRVEQTIGTQPPIEKLKHTDELHINDWVQQKIDLDQSPTDTYEVCLKKLLNIRSIKQQVDKMLFSVIWNRSSLCVLLSFI